MEDRERIRAILSKEPNLTSSNIAKKTGLPNARVSSHLSSMVSRTKEVIKNKVSGAYSTYTLAPAAGDAYRITSINIKLAQLRSLETQLLKVGLTTIPEIIRDYESLL